MESLPLCGVATVKGWGVSVLHEDLALRVGDYLRIASHRMATDGHRTGEGYARIERVEHIDPPVFLHSESTSWIARHAATHTNAAVFCHGLPGPVLLRLGDHRVLDEVDADRQQHDLAHPWWPVEQALMFTNSHLPTEPHYSREIVTGPTAVTGTRRPIPGRRAQVFAKPASALMVGDYLQIHATRFPETDMGTDEGFHRVESVQHLPEHLLPALLADPSWAHGRLTAATVHGLSGTVLLPEAPVTVLVAPNEERRRNDETELWWDGVFHAFTGATEPVPAQQQIEDLKHRPAPDPVQGDLYPSRFDNAFDRAMHMDGVSAVRPVATSELPWPHDMFRCPHRARGHALAATYPAPTSDDGPDPVQVAHAELFTRLRPDDFAACPYHQGDWPAIITAVTAIAAAEERDEDNLDTRPRILDQLNPHDRHWASQLLADHLWWDQGDTHLTNGQHRLCALRAAGVAVVPVYGRHLPDTPHPDADAVPEASDHARRTVQQFWRDRLAQSGTPRPLTALRARILARYPALRPPR